MDSVWRICAGAFGRWFWIISIQKGPMKRAILLPKTLNRFVGAATILMCQAMLAVPFVLGYKGQVTPTLGMVFGSVWASQKA